MGKGNYAGDITNRIMNEKEFQFETKTPLPLFSAHLHNTHRISGNKTLGKVFF